MSELEESTCAMFTGTIKISTLGSFGEYYVSSLSNIEWRNYKTLFLRMGMMMMIWRVPWLSTPARTMMKTTSPPSTLAAATASLRSQAPLWRPTRPQWRVAEAAASLALLSAATESINCVLWDILSLTNPLYSCVLSFRFKSWINLALVTSYCFLLSN